MSRTGLGPETEVAESGAWTKPRCSLQDLPPRGRPAIPRRLNALDREPGCSLQDLPPRGRPAIPRRLNALDREPGCSLQADRCAASDRVPAAVAGCGLPHRDESASNSSDSRDEPHATSAGCRRSLERIQDRPNTSCAGTLYAAWPDTPADCKRPGRDGVWKGGKLAGNTGSSVAGKSLPPRYV